jgi:hypothetical protein
VSASCCRLQLLCVHHVTLLAATVARGWLTCVTATAYPPLTSKPISPIKLTQVHTFVDGSRYEGVWEQDMLHGRGIFYYRFVVEGFIQTQI